jgi:hypothetical protein
VSIFANKISYYNIPLSSFNHYSKNNLSLSRHNTDNQLNIEEMAKQKPKKPHYTHSVERVKFKERDSRDPLNNLLEDLNNQK